MKVLLIKVEQANSKLVSEAVRTKPLYSDCVVAVIVDPTCISFFAYASKDMYLGRDGITKCKTKQEYVHNNAKHPSLRMGAVGQKGVMDPKSCLKKWVTEIW